MMCRCCGSSTSTINSLSVLLCSVNGKLSNCKEYNMAKKLTQIIECWIQKGAWIRNEERLLQARNPETGNRKKRNLNKSHAKAGPE
jgi:hypothetical protein